MTDGLAAPMTMDGATAQLIAAMYRACVDEGMGFAGDWAVQKPLVVEALTVTGATRHELWDLRLISDAEHDMATCDADYCAGSREIEAALGQTDTDGDDL